MIALKKNPEQAAPVANDNQSTLASLVRTGVIRTAPKGDIA